MDAAEREQWSETLAATHAAFAEFVNSEPDDEAHIVKPGGKLTGAQLHTVLRYHRGSGCLR